MRLFQHDGDCPEYDPEDFNEYDRTGFIKRMSDDYLLGAYLKHRDEDFLVEMNRRCCPTLTCSESFIIERFEKYVNEKVVDDFDKI